MVSAAKAHSFLVMGYGSGPWGFLCLLCLSNSLFRKNDLSMDSQNDEVAPRSACCYQPTWKSAGVDFPPAFRPRKKLYPCCPICRRPVVLLHHFTYDRSTISALCSTAATFSIWDGAVLPALFLCCSKIQKGGIRVMQVSLENQIKLSISGYCH